MPETDIRELPIWKGSIEIEPLSGGITNLNYRVVDGDKGYAVRTGQDDPVLGIDRKNELTCTMAAANLGLAPKVVYSQDGLMVCEFIESTALTPELATQCIERLADAVRQIHTKSREVCGHMQHFSAFQVTRTFLAAAQEQQLPLPGGGAQEMLTEIGELEGFIQPFTPTFCHNDMMPGNFLDTGSKIWVIDWEYSGIGHPLFDLAGLSSNCDFQPEHDNLLLASYGASNEETLLQFRALKAMAALRESLWSVIQREQSSIAFDYDLYRDENYDKYRTFKGAIA